MSEPDFQFTHDLPSFYVHKFTLFETLINIKHWASYICSHFLIKNLYFIVLLDDVGPHNIRVRCWEFSLNLSLYVQLFKHPIVIFKGLAEQELHVE